MLGVDTNMNLPTVQDGYQISKFQTDIPDFLTGPAAGLNDHTMVSELSRSTSPFTMDMYSPFPILARLSRENSPEEITSETTPPRHSEHYELKSAEPDSTFTTPPAGTPEGPNDTLQSDSPIESPESTSSSEGKKRNVVKRTIFTQGQLAALERRFIQQSFLSRDERLEVAQRLNISERQVMVWFQNRRGRLKKRGSADMAYNPVKLNELNNRRPYPFLYGMISSMHYQTSPYQQMWSAYPDEVKDAASSAVGDTQTGNSTCGGKMPSALSSRTHYRDTNMVHHPMRKSPVVSPANGMTPSDHATRSYDGNLPALKFENISPSTSPTGHLLTSVAQQTSPVNAQPGHSPIGAMPPMLSMPMSSSPTEAMPPMPINPHPASSSPTGVMPQISTSIPVSTTSYPSNYFRSSVHGVNGAYDNSYYGGYQGYHTGVNTQCSTMPIMTHSQLPTYNPHYNQTQMTSSNVYTPVLSQNNTYPANFWSC